jgi:hypothetical protein
LQPSSIKEITVDGIPAIQGQVNPPRDRYLTMFIKNNERFGFLTAEPTKENEELSNRIFSTFDFIE